MKKLYVFIALTTLLTACSNPFSSQKSSILKENQKPQNNSCSEIQLDQSEVSVKQFRAVIHCFNQSNELKEIESWIQSVSDEELKPWLNQYNSILKNEPHFLYALKEMYVQERNNGELQHLLNQFFIKLHHEEEKKLLVTLLQNHSKWIQNFLTSSRYQINTANLALLSEVQSFQRSVNEQFKTKNLNSLIQSIEKYRSEKDSLSFQELFDFFSAAGSKSIARELQAKEVSGFLNWLLEKNRIQTFSIAAEKLISDPITCFNNGKVISDSLNTLIVQLQSIPPKELPEFLQKNLGAALLAGQGYCKIPTEVISAANELMKSTSQENLVGFFAFIQPLLKDPRFVTLLASKSFRNLANELSNLNNTHIFQDIVSLVVWSDKNPVSERNTAELMDSIFDEFNSKDLWSLINFIPEDARFFNILDKMIQSLPSLKKTKSITIQGDWLAPITKESFVSVLNLTSQMNDDHKIFPIIDRIIELFRTMLDQGRATYQAAKITKPVHAFGSKSQLWQLSFWKNNTTVSSYLNCSGLSLDINLFEIMEPFTTETYLNNLDEISKCYGTNQSFLSIKELAVYLAKQNTLGKSLNQFSSLQSGLMGFIFSLDHQQAFYDFERMLKLNSNDLPKIKEALGAASNIISAAKPTLQSAVETRKLIGKYASKKETYSALLQQLESTNSTLITQDIKPKLIEKTLTALPKLFEEYCYSLNVAFSDCDIDPDQVQLYNKSPALLAAQIVDEYLSMPQSWIHPLEFKKWGTEITPQKNVSSLNFHLEPLLKQIDQKPDALHSIFSFIKRNQESKLKLLSFLQDRAKNVQVIPYIFHKGNYPETSKEFHQFVRLRIINDIDRLELLAINADFKPFGRMKNFGMTFVQEIATSWGDLPFDQRPKLATSETLSQARLSILSQFYTFNKNVLQRIGSCDPRGKNRVGHWIQNRFCKGELSDIRARMFNLNLMLPILDNPETLILLRDLFYSIYEKNTDEQRGVYTNGVKDVEYDQNMDLLEMIPKIARLGILHQAGVSFLKEQAIATKAIISILNQTVIQKQDLEISKSLTTTNGQIFINDLLKFSMSLEEKENKHISILLQQLSQLKNQDWLIFMLKISHNDPKILSNFSETIHEVLLKLKLNDLSNEMNQLLSALSADLNNEALIIEVSSLLKSLPATQKNLSTLLQFELSENIGEQWIKLLAKDQNQSYRDQISRFIVGNGFDDLCDVFSDTQLVNKTYKFLEESNQNSGVNGLLEQCRRFLH